jgi:undecaprenyl-diphosphatase
MDQARHRTVAAGVVLLLGYAAVTAFVVVGLPLGPDIAITRAIQAVSWPPFIQPFFALLDYIDGARQVVLALAVIAATYLICKRTTRVALVCLLSGLAYYVSQLAIHRPRPPVGLVRVIRHTGGYSYPSGHAIFYFWALTVLILAIRARQQGWAIPAAVCAVALYAAVLVSRIYAGEHWPSDCLGGALLGAGWTVTAIGVVGVAEGQRPQGDAAIEELRR